MTSPALPTRRPYRGSCHCGSTRYIVFLSLPPSAHKDRTRFYRCNCSTCHKAAIFHTRPSNPHNDFLLLSPLDPESALGNYRTFAKEISFFFCKTCGGRCFSLGGTGEVVELDLAEWMGEGVGEGETLGEGQGKGKGQTTKAWRVHEQAEGRGERGPYLSVNAHSIEVGQGLDLSDLTKGGLVEYIDCRSPEGERGEVRYDYPHAGGSF